MKMKGFVTVLSTSVAVGATTAFASALAPRASTLPTVSVKGNAFFAGNNRFYIRGVDYQPGGSSNLVDPIADEAICTRDIPEFTKLGINTVRIYTVDNSKNHDACMNALAAAGIYLVLDVNTPKYSINRATPAPSYNDVYLQNVFATIDSFANYTNTLAFFSGNEVINDNTTTNCAPYVKAVTRDMRQYIGSRGYRSIPVGYSAADVDSNRFEMAQYMNCGTNDERSDFFAFNDYSWCAPSSFETSGWAAKVQTYSNYSIPIFLSEYGCNKHTRTFEEVAALYNTEMTSVYSGGLVYEYSQEESKYGLVQLNGNSVTEFPDFTALKSAFAGTSNPTGDGGYKSSGSPSTCPPQSSTWNVTSDALPALPGPAAKFMKQGAGAGVGLTGAGSQDAGTQSSGTATAGSGTATSTAASGKKTGAASDLRAPEMAVAPIICGLVVLASTFLGATLL